MHSSKIVGLVSLAPERPNLISRLFLWSINNIVPIAIYAKSTDLCVYGQFSFLILLISNKAVVLNMCVPILSILSLLNRLNFFIVRCMHSCREIMIPFLGRHVINVVLTRRRKQVSNNFFFSFSGQILY